MASRFLFFIISILIFSCTQKTEFLPADSNLKIGQATDKRTLKKHAPDTFKLKLDKGGIVYGFADQLTADVVVAIIDPTGKEIGSFDEPARGAEFFNFQTDTSGVYKIVISPFKEEAGDYTLILNGAELLSKDPKERIAQLVRVSLGSFNGPGATVAVQQNGKIIYSEGFGHADIEQDVHNTSSTIYHIASVSKQFTAFAIAMLADQGKLSLNDDIRKYIPEMHDFGTPITINHLVHHTSGLRDQWNLVTLAGWRFDDVITQKQLVRVITRQTELNFKPGEEMVYCNTGFTLMAEIVSRVSGQPFTEWTQKNIFVPLEMNSTFFYDDHERIVNNRAYSYYRTQDGGYKKRVLSYANVGATSLFTTVEDLSKWAVNFEKMTVGNPKVMEMMEQRFVLNNGDTINYAFGQSIQKYKGLKTVSHGGADAGYRTYFLRFPEQHFSVSVFSNLGSFLPGDISYRIADIYLSEFLKPEPETDSPAPEPAAPPAFDASTIKLSDFTGDFYSTELETFYTLTIKNDTLVASHQRHDNQKLVPWKEDEFSNGFFGSIAFIRDKSKKVNALKISNGRVRNVEFRKVKNVEFY